MKNISEKEKNLLKKLQNHNDMVLRYSEDNYEINLSYYLEDKCYREKEKGWFKFDLELLFDLAKGKIEGVELK